MIVALCGLFSKDEVLSHTIEFSGSEETIRSLPIDARLTISNMTTEIGAISRIFPIDDVLQKKHLTETSRAEWDRQTQRHISQAQKLLLQAPFTVS